MPTTERDAVQLQLAKVNHGFRGFAKDTTVPSKAGSCEVDVICPAGDGWRNEVAHLVAATPDLAPGTAHFRLSIGEGQAILAALRARLSGLAHPTYVLDIPGGYGKVPIGPDYVHTGLDGSVQVTDPHGRVHRYPG